MSNATTNATVTVDFKFSAGKDPIWGISPAPVDMNYGATDTITWNLVPVDENGSSIAATFANIIFGANWPNQQPTPVANSQGLQYSVADNNNNRTGQAINYHYTVVVSYKGVHYRRDPEERNEPQ